MHVPYSIYSEISSEGDGWGSKERGRRSHQQNMQDGRSQNHKGSNAAGLCTHVRIDSTQRKRGKNRRAYQGNILAKVPSSEFYKVCDAVTCFFRDARNHYCTTQDNSADAVRIMKERKKAEEDLHNYYEVPSGTYSPQQLLQMLQICKLEAPVLYLPMLLASTAGLRISEILTVTFRDIHFYNQTICLQLPVKDDLPNRTDTITIPEENTKMVYLADFVMDEIRLQKERLEACQKTDPDFNPSGYLIWGRNGSQRQNNFINKPYARICAKCPFPTFPWKELRRIKLSASSMKRFTETLGAENSGQPQPREIPQIPIDRSDLIELMK